MTTEVSFEPAANGLALIPPELSLRSAVEAIVFAAPEPMQPSAILEVIGDPGLSVRAIEAELSALLEEYNHRAGGFRLLHIKGSGYHFRTVESASGLMERMFSSRPRQLSKPALETLAIVAYRQPVTRAEVEFIRGVDAGSIMKNLIDRELITCVGRKEDAGRPMLFGTTPTFLEVFSLDSLSALPPLESFQPSPESMKGAREQLEHQSDEATDAELGFDDTPVPSELADDDADNHEATVEGDGSPGGSPTDAGGDNSTTTAGGDNR